MLTTPLSPGVPIDAQQPWVIHGSFTSENDGDTCGWAIDTDASDADVWVGGTLTFTFDGTTTVVGVTDGTLTSGVAYDINQSFEVTADDGAVINWTGNGPPYPDGYAGLMSWSATHRTFDPDGEDYITTFNPGVAPPDETAGAHVGIVAEGPVPG